MFGGSWMDAFLSKIGMGDLFDELVVVGLAVCLLLASFSREKDEDECIAHLRMQAWTLDVGYCVQLPDSDCGNTLHLRNAISQFYGCQYVYRIDFVSCHFSLETFAFQKGES